MFFKNVVFTMGDNRVVLLWPHSCSFIILIINPIFFIKIRAYETCVPSIIYCHSIDRKYPPDDHGAMYVFRRRASLTYLFCRYAPAD